jgi:hypothetical protein
MTIGEFKKQFDAFVRLHNKTDEDQLAYADIHSGEEWAASEFYGDFGIYS